MNNPPLERTAAAVYFACGRTSRVRRLGRSTALRYVAVALANILADNCDPSEIGAVVAEMEQFRGEIEGGLCVRRVEPFITDSERRYFVLDGKAFSPDGQLVPELVFQVASRIPSPFFSVDVVRRDDGVLRVVEVGDGQVSDLGGWWASAFVAMWAAVRPAVYPALQRIGRAERSL